ncbi:YcaO-like family protein [Plantactinospora soyae]|uniref:Ribosomal protein S12 methylthiotransferase accessory factor n=1 Tax=Plantactinospora soyae TaxID=1544732 RepID=A0A927QWW6_9ACTN|nr:YcaO-like family protein [Plantactinospora soyae]MBE1487380.1 ribosomal protein S12 methylthiotransferase accessory factor [Plantactinospora soyae]
MRLRDRVAKAYGSGAHREYAADWTYARLRPYFRHLGITRLADISGLDRVGIPVYQAIVPGSIDRLCVYSGKGPTPVEARTSAVMEVLERFSGWLPLRPTTIAAYRELAAAGRPALRPAEHNLGLLPAYHDDLPIYWVTGHDLLADQPVLVPHSAVCYTGYPGAPPCYALTTSNGLASGNSLEEAIFHALCELIERDAMTIAEIVGSRLAGVLASGVVSPNLTAREAARLTTDRQPRLDPGTVPPSVRPLVRRFEDAGLRLYLWSIGSDLGVPTVAAYASEASDDTGRPTSDDGVGHGAHPDLEVALTRAITECAQSRAVAAGPIRSAAVPPGDRDVPMAPRRTAIPDGGGLIPVSELASYPSDDIVADLRLLLDRLRAAGLGRVVVVDLSPPELPGHVVRVLVPGLESWAIDRSKLGARAAGAWSRAVRELGEFAGRPGLPDRPGGTGPR